MLDLTSHRACQLAFSNGHTHDFTLFKESIGYSLLQSTLVPAKRSKHHLLTEEDRRLNREIAKIHIEVEHFNAKFKTFQIMAQPYRNRRKRFELRAELICGIINHEMM